jgi:hypothetical protein
MIRLILLTVTVFNFSVLATADQIEEIIQLRKKIEIQSTENDKIFERINEEEDVFQRKLTEIKSQILKEKLKNLQLKQMIQQFQSSRAHLSVNSQNNLSSKDVQKISMLIEKKLSELLPRIHQNQDWKNEIASISSYIKLDQINLFELKLVTFLEKKLFESNQVKKNFLTLEGENIQKSVYEVLQLGYFASFAKNSSLNKYYSFSPEKGWQPVQSDSAIKTINHLHLDYQNNRLHFIPLKDFPELEQNKGSFYVFR